jgi:hypothetical protein
MAAKPRKTLISQLEKSGEHSMWSVLYFFVFYGKSKNIHKKYLTYF